MTILFADVVASTELADRLDPEAVRQVVTRYFDEMATVLEAHGGTVEKFIGDEVMAVFGVPTVHEDDALRAVRAAAAMHERLRALNAELEATWGAPLTIRIGINTGEVIAGDPSPGHGFVTGSAVNVAKRLEQAAEPGEILLGDATHRLVRHAVKTTPIGPISLRGRREHEAPQRLEEVRAEAEALARRLDAPLVGRRGELARLKAAYAQAVEGRRAHLVTLLGTAGIGKSRLAWALLDEVAAGAEVLVGRCVPYGEGVTFLPVRQILPDEPLTGTNEEIFRRIRNRLEERAGERPLVVCFDDIHWGEPAFLDLIQYLAGWIRGAPVLLLCLGRPELLERRADWLHPQGDADVLILGALKSDAIRQLLARLDAPEAAIERIVEAAEGNPLFVEQIAALAAERGEDVEIPPSIKALLAARLGLLEADETAVIGHAAVVGRDFTIGAVLELLPGELRPRVSQLLLALVRKELIRPRPVHGDDGFRFRHALIRDAAYDALPKQVRAGLHESHAAWLEARRAEHVLVGYHLEQAVLLRRVMGLEDERAETLASRASDLLGSAGVRAARRGDISAAVALLERAVVLVGDAPAYLIEFGTALTRAGEFARAERVLDQAHAAARSAGDRRLELRATVERQFVRSFASASRASSENSHVAESVIPELERFGDDKGLAKAWWLLSETAVIEGRWADRARALERALGYARRTPDARNETSAATALLAQALYYGPTPAEEGVEQCRALIAEAADDGVLRAGVCISLAGFRAMQGGFDEARGLFAEAMARYDELGLRFPRMTAAPIGATIEALAGDTDTAERLLREAYEALEAMGERGVRSTLAASLADLLAPLDRAEETEALAAVAQALAEPDDVATQVLWRAPLARVRARSGDPEQALRLAREARALAGATDSPQLHVAALVAQGEAAAAAGDEVEARDLLWRAVSFHRAKGNVVAADRLAASLAQRQLVESARPQ